MFAIGTVLVVLAAATVWAVVADVRTRRHGSRFRGTSDMWRYEREARRVNRVAVQVRGRGERVALPRD